MKTVDTRYAVRIRGRKGRPDFFAHSNEGAPCIMFGRRTHALDHADIVARECKISRRRIKVVKVRVTVEQLTAGA